MDPYKNRGFDDSGPLTGDSRTIKPQRKDRAYMPGWVRDFRKNPIPRLLHSNDPTVIFDVYWDLMGLDKKHPLMSEAIENINNNPKAVKFIGNPSETIAEDSDESILYGMEFLNHLIRMNKIVRFRLNKENPILQNDILKLMGFIKDDGRFPLLYHHHAHACWILLKLGLNGNRILDKSIYWLVKKQRFDGGWLHRSFVSDGDDFSTAPSCIWTTMEVMYMLIKREIMLKKTDVEKACNFLMDHIEKQNNTRFMNHQNAWNNLSISTGKESMFAGGTLKLLEILAGCGYDMSDHKIQKLIKWLKGIQLDNGLFPREAGKLSIGDDSVTIRALSVYKKLKFKNKS